MVSQAISQKIHSPSKRESASPSIESKLESIDELAKSVSSKFVSQAVKSGKEIKLKALQAKEKARGYITDPKIHRLHT